MVPSGCPWRGRPHSTPVCQRCCLAISRSRSVSNSKGSGGEFCIRYPSLQSALARNRTWSSTFAGSRANPAHPEDNVYASVPRRGIEPRLADSKSAVLIHHTRKAQVARSGIEPDLRASETLVRSGTHTGQCVLVSRPGIEPGLEL